MNNDDTFNPNTDDNLTPELEARVVAWVLGEASAFEVAELERLCAEQPELAVFKRRIEAINGLVRSAARPHAQAMVLSPERRAKVLALIGEPDAEHPATSRAKARKDNGRMGWRAWALPVAACLAVMLILAGVLIPTVGAVKMSSRKAAFEADARQLDQLAMIERAENESVQMKSKRESAPGDSMTFGSTQPEEPSSSLTARGNASINGVADTTVSFAMEMPSMPELSSSSLATAGSGFAVGSVSEDTSRRDGIIEDTSYLRGPAPTPVAAPARPKRPETSSIVLGGGNSSQERVQMDGVVDLDYKVESDNLYAGPPVPLHEITGSGFPPRSYGQTTGEVSITAGTTQTFRTTSVMPAGSRQLSESEKNSFYDSASIVGAKPAADGYALADEYVVTSAPVAGEFKQNQNQSLAGADYFFAPPLAPAPASGSNFLGSTSSVVTEGQRESELGMRGRSQYIAGDLEGAERTFRQMEARGVDSPDSKYFMTRITKDKAAVGELNREKTRAAQLQEVSSAWQRPGVYNENTKNLEPWDSPNQPRRKRSSVSITAGTPQKMEGIVFTEADRVEIARRIALRKAERLKKQLASSGLKTEEQPKPLYDEKTAKWMGFNSPEDMEDSMEVSREFTEEIKAIEAKAEQQAKSAVDESLRAETVTSAQAVSTFSLHVSDASFRIAQAALARGELPDASTVRPEEFYNAFDYGDAAPVAGEPVACRIEQAAHPFLQQRNLVRIAMKVPAAGRSASQPLRLTVLLDTSGSMEREDRAATVRAALGSLASLLGPADRVTLIGFARTPRLLAVNVRGDQAAQLVEIAAQTPAEGGTNLEEALELAGHQARLIMVPNAQNRIVLLTDGAANLGNADPQRLSQRIEAFRHKGIAFDACGVVADGLDDGVLEALTRKGDGRYVVINAPEEADANFARTLAGAFRPAAKDVKVQVRFNAARVASYRLIGFEQHRLRTEDFRNNAIDAAELAAEEAANALYQIQVLPEGEGELGEVFVRFLDPSTGFYVERSWTLTYDAQAPAFTKAAPSLQLAGSAAFLAEKLRGGELAGQVRLDEFAPVVNGLGAAYPGATRVQQFIEMFRQSRRVLGE